jgi:hypothetical protein
VTVTTTAAPAAAPVQPMPVVLAAVVLAHTQQVQQIRDQALAAVLSLWALLRFPSLESQWPDIGERMFIVLATAQEAVASLADDYADSRDGAVVPPAFTGASDGRDLESLLLQTLIRVRVNVSRGQSPDEAMASGAALLTRITSTQVLDSARIADQVAITSVDPEKLATDAEFERIIRDFYPALGTLKGSKRERLSREFGYVRVLNPPSCGRCALLAGRFYKWSQGFQRHDNCDCQHIPMFVAAAQGVTVDPEAYFNSLTRQEQIDYFGAAATKAILDARVMSIQRKKGGLYTAGGKRYTTEATTRRGFYGRDPETRGTPRMTPEQIYKDAGDDRILALSMLERYGYILR